MGYILGVSTGAFGVAGAEERPQLVGLFKKAQAGITKGVNFVQLDLESISEFEEPGLEKRMKEDIKGKLGIEFGIHSETRAFGVEAAELDSAIKMEYKRAHDRLIWVLKHSKDIGAKYVLVHSSESEPFHLLERVLQACDLVDPEGNSMREFLTNNKWLLNWLISGSKDDKSREIIEILMDIWREKGKERGRIEKEDVEKVFKERGIKPQNFFWLELLRGRTLEEYLQDRIMNRVQSYEIQVGKKYTEAEAVEQAMIDEGIRRFLEITFTEIFDYVISLVNSRELQYGPERWAYYFVAKWMEENKDPLWEKIVNASIKFFAKRDGKGVEEWMEKKGISQEKLTIEDDNFRTIYEIWVPAVSARYIFGHFFPKKDEYKDPKEYLSEDGMIFALESPMGGRGIEEWLRLANPYQYYFLVEEANKLAGKNIFAVAMDFEHMLSLRIDPQKVIELLPEDGGKHVRVIHAGWPSTLAPAHLPIEVGSDQQKYLYEMYYKLRQKGFGKYNDCYIIFERGGPESFQQSIISLQLIIEFLKKDIPPEKLIEHPEFFGIDVKQIMSEERQKTIIREHAFDPLKGLIAVPEETHGFLGRAAVEKGKPEEWRRERYR
ncbi:MAG: hypothetical protein QW040_03845 [Candidatus Aenigmatarchaeota archaeon]